MRTIVLFICLIFSCSVLVAQPGQGLVGTYVRYKCLEDGGRIKQTLKLFGATSGRYTLAEEGDETPDYTSGYWIRSKVWRRREDSMQVVILNYENEHHTTYLEIERSGCLTPVCDNGDRPKRANAFAPVRKQRADR